MIDFDDFLGGLFGSGKKPRFTNGDITGGATWTTSSKTSRVETTTDDGEPFTVEVNGARHTGRNHIVITGNTVIIDGQKISVDKSPSTIELVVVEGKINNLIALADVHAGDVGSASISGDATVGDVRELRNVMGDLTAETIKGDARAMGDITAGVIHGKVKAMGDVNIGK